MFAGQDKHKIVTIIRVHFLYVLCIICSLPDLRSNLNFKITSKGLERFLGRLLVHIIYFIYNYTLDDVKGPTFFRAASLTQNMEV